MRKMKENIAYLSEHGYEALAGDLVEFYDALSTQQLWNMRSTLMGTVNLLVRKMKRAEENEEFANKVLDVLAKIMAGDENE